MSEPKPNPPETDKPGTLSVEGLHKLLDAEIAHAWAAETRPGWTEWVLIASIAAVLWKFLSEVSSTASANAAWAAGLCVFLVLDALWALRRMLERVDPDRRDRYQRPQDLWNMAPEYGLAQCMRFIAMFYAIKVAPAVQPEFFRLAAVLYAFTGLFIASIPYGKWQVALVREHELRAFGLVLVGLCISLALFISVLRGLVVTHASIPDIRVGTLGAAVVYLCLLLANARKQSPMLRSLIKVRRQLALGEVTLSQAAKDTEIALLGVTLATALQTWVTYFTDELERQQRQLALASDQYSSVRDRLEPLEAGQRPPAGDDKLFQTMLASANVVVGNVETAKRSSWDAKFTKMDAYAKQLAAQNAEEYKRTRSVLSSSRAAIDDQVSKLKAKIEELQAHPALNAPDDEDSE